MEQCCNSKLPLREKGGIVRILFGLLLLAVAAPVTYCQAAPTHQPAFSLTLTAVTPSVQSGSDVHIKISMKNLSNHDLDCTRGYSNGLDRVYEYDVRDSSGKTMEILTKKHPEIGQTFSPGPECALKPGESIDSGGVISTFYDMTQAGEYTIQVSRRVSNNPKDGVVKSNKITIAISPGPKQPPPPPPQN